MSLEDVLIKPWMSKYRGIRDNRSYIYSKDSNSTRSEFELIARWVKPESKVLDLGCGDGSLMFLLKHKKSANTEGIEISPSGVAISRKKGLKTRKARIDEKLPYKKDEFDYAICNATLQMVMYPEVLLSEMKRVSKRQIISFLNFAFLPNRFDLLINGRMPQIMIPGYQWFSTGHIHQLSIADFKEYCRKNSIQIIKEKYIYPGDRYSLGKFSVGNRTMSKFPNVFASMAIFMTR